MTTRPTTSPRTPSSWRRCSTWPSPSTIATAGNGKAEDKDNLVPQFTLADAKYDSDGGSSGPGSLTGDCAKDVPAANTGTAIPGTHITYHIVVENLGPSTATGVTVSDTFPG